MIEIKKGKEPYELLSYRKKADANYDDMDCKQIVLESLMREQGYLCAYCMRRIPEARNLPIGVHPATIEHWEAQSATGEDKRLDYANMLAVCAGNRGCGDKKNMTCDAKRGNTALTVDPRKSEIISRISYRNNGIIYSDDPAINRDLNDTLGLNNEAVSLPQSRKSALDALLKKIRSTHPTGDIRPYCEKLLKALMQQERKTPYVGIQIWWLKNHIKKSR